LETAWAIRLANSSVGESFAGGFVFSEDFTFSEDPGFCSFDFATDSVFFGDALFFGGTGFSEAFDFGEGGVDDFDRARLMALLQESRDRNEERRASRGQSGGRPQRGRRIRPSRLQDLVDAIRT
jgi:hypothetical protein